VLNGVWNDEMIVDAIKHEALAYYHEDPDRFPLTVTTSPENVNPDSLDLCLGNQIRLPMWYWRNSITRGIAHLIEKARPGSTQMWEKDTRVFDTYTLWPGQFVLCHSKETMQVPDDAVAMLFSKSSTGRTGLEHLHAGLGDSGFKGEWTWEFTNTAPWPITLVAGKRLMQVIFISMAKEPGMVYSKTGRYQGQSGPTAARN
jgi:deoxycytidine triphosphate deaminase